MVTSEKSTELVAPGRLPFLESLSWFDRTPYDLAPLDMLRRYESGWRYMGLPAEPSAEEWVFIQQLVQRFGSYLDVQT